MSVPVPVSNVGLEGGDVARAISTNGRTWYLSTPGLVGVSLVAHALLSGGYFLLAGTWRLPWHGAALGLLAVCQLALVVVVFGRDPDLARERMKAGDPGQPLWDRVFLKVFGLLLAIDFALAPLDAGRLHLTDPLPDPARAAGLVALAGGMGIVIWSMRVNTYFSKLVRIQTERGHRVIASGPYARVRHPGYVGFLLLMLGFLAATGSPIALAGGLVAVLVPLVYRTSREDRFLHRNLPGYADYAARVRWRLVPGVW